VDKAATDFYNRTQANLRKECKLCFKQRSKQNHAIRKTKPKVKVNMQHCTKCMKLKPAGDFHKDIKTPTGIYSLCKPCAGTERDTRKYKITEKKLKDLISQLSCEICKTELPCRKDKKIDHNHATGNVRGILCNDCNQGLGRFKDDTRLLANAIAYLNKNK
jgi:hypothetical protein